MNKRLTELYMRFKKLEAREQLAIWVLGVCLLLVTLYLGVWSPANRYASDGRLGHDTSLALLLHLHATEQEARVVAGRESGQRMTGQDLLTAVSRTAQTLGVVPRRIQPEGSESVSVWLDSIAFSQLMSWLEYLQAQQGIIVRQITIDRREQPGLISARLVLQG